MDLVDNGIVMDWFINDAVVVEFFGIVNNELYYEKTAVKQQTCEKNNFNSLDVICDFFGSVG